MDRVSVKAFFNRHPHLKEDKPGLYKFLADIYWREQYKATIDEAEHLVKLKFAGPANADPGIWARELERYRKEQRLKTSP